MLLAGWKIGEMESYVSGKTLVPTYPPLDLSQVSDFSETFLCNAIPLQLSKWPAQKES